MQVVDYAGQIVLVPALDDPIQQALGLLRDGPSLTEALLGERERERQREADRLSS